MSRSLLHPVSFIQAVVEFLVTFVHPSFHQGFVAAWESACLLLLHNSSAVESSALGSIESVFAVSAAAQSSPPAQALIVPFGQRLLREEAVFLLWVSGVLSFRSVLRILGSVC